MKEDINIDELLNSFLDGEATRRERIEVQRLLIHDAQVAKRFRELEKCRLLVGSLPYAEAPAEILQQIKASMGKSPAGTLRAEVFKRRRGARHLLIRQTISVAAMVVLVAVLGVVVYTILAPESPRKQPAAAEDLKLPVKKIVIEPEKTVQPLLTKAEKPIEGAKRFSQGFSGTLRLKTKALAAVDASVGRAIEDSGLALYSLSKQSGGEHIYTVAGSREAVNLFLSDLDSIWGKFDSATLFVEAGQVGKRVVVDNVKTGQIAEIFKQDDSEARIKVAKDIASFNRIEKQLPGEEMFAAVGHKEDDLITIPKPVLTSGERPITKPAGGAAAKEEVLLTIVIVGSE
jgi:hypothetical protein